MVKKAETNDSAVKTSLINNVFKEFLKFSFLPYVSAKVIKFWFIYYRRLEELIFISHSGGEIPTTTQWFLFYTQVCHITAVMIDLFIQQFFKNFFKIVEKLPLPRNLSWDSSPYLSRYWGRLIELESRRFWLSVTIKRCFFFQSSPTFRSSCWDLLQGLLFIFSKCE